MARRKARTGLEAFTCYTFPGYTCEPAHSLIARTLDQVVSGEIKRLMIFAPHQHGKSELASVRLPAYWLARRPDDPVLMTSYAASLAETHSLAARTCLESPAFAALFPELTTRKDRRAANDWRLAGRRGGVLASGVGGPIQGHGGMLALVDDPFENWAQAQSLTIRNKVHEWYKRDLRTRVWEGGAIVLILSRFHPDDLPGRLLREQGDEWHVLRLPATAETQEERDANNRALGLPKGLRDPLGRRPGEPLCPRRFSAQALASLRRDVGPLAWPGQYQGVPHEAEGNVYQRSWFPRFIDRGDHYVLQPSGEIVLRADCTIFVSADPAGGISDQADKTAIGTFALTPAHNLLLLDVFCERIPVERIAAKLAEVYGLTGADYLIVESVFLQSTYARQLRQQYGASVREFKPGGKSKLARAVPAITRAEARQIYLPDPVAAEWVDGFLDELLAFTGMDDAHDDQVDMLSQAVATVERWKPGDDEGEPMRLRERRR